MAKTAMNNEQEKALKSLERAFKRCKKTGLVFFGMDGDVIAYDEKSYREIYNENECGYETQQKLSNSYKTSYTVDTCGAYIDSGGW